MKRSKQEHQFKEKVYRIVASIPHGKVLSYQQVAEIAGSPHAYRAVGNILNKHQIKKLPCHRVIKSDGGVGGYRWGKKKKIMLLKKEGVKINAKGKIIFER
ncbi:MAG TPA: MGMT family protein [Candidatus Paceibacterota bacterium]|nr:MGMT family protein [Candidatus Paceibacterota bacterium]HOL53937.1 MGMT family protein [Candidatus Paceibacterota bacterium]HON21961.1 MGMT family protein [Candidatus Paceibacterota bacterium]HPP16960.1 MGMT family protein [Candidatus Paceibacterota bacterium]